MERIKLIVYVLMVCTVFNTGIVLTAQGQTWGPTINFTEGQSFKYAVTHKNVVSGNLSKNRDTEEQYLIHFKVLEKKGTYCRLAIEYSFNDPTVNTLFDFIHKVVRPSFTILINMEQVTMDIENDDEVIQLIDRYVEAGNEYIEGSKYQESLKKAIQSPNKEEILYGQLFSDLYVIFAHFWFEEISIKDTLEYTRPLYSNLINQKAVADATFYVKDFRPGDYILFIEELVIPGYGDLYLEHTRKVLEGIKSKKPTEDFPKPDITHTSINEIKIDIKSSLTISLSSKVTINLQSVDGTINNEMGVTYVLMEK
ncbi:hypothetical protein [Parapedobacter sp.]